MASMLLHTFRRYAIVLLASVLCPNPCAVLHAEQGFRPEESTAKPLAPGTVVRAADNAESIISGIYINGNDRGTITAYLRNNEYWIPWELFLDESGLKPEETETGKTQYATSIGIIAFESDALETIENTTCISFSSLKQVFRVFPAFNQSLYAVMLTIPWQAGAPRKTGSTTATKKADIFAPGSSLSFIRIESDLLYDFKTDPDKNLLLETGGRLLDGTWNMTLEGDPEREMEPTQYHWTTYNRQLAFRAGTGTPDLYSIIDSRSFTGTQFGWSNRNIIRYLDFDRYSDSETFLAIDRTQLQTLEGDGPPAGIAELRFDGIVVARQRINLEGKFIFRNVRISTDLRKTEVYLYERSLADPPATILDFTRRLSGRMLPKGELLIRGGAGKSGNILDSDNADRDENICFGHVQYGISGRMSIEAGIGNNIDTGTADYYGRTILSIGGNWAAALYGARSNDRYAGEFRLEGSGRYWQASLWSNLQEKQYGEDDALQRERNALSFSLRPFRTMTVSLYGLSETINSRKSQEYLLPGIYWGVFPGVQISATPNEDEQYRYESSFRLSASGNLRVAYENDIVSAEYAQSLNEKLSMRVLNTYARKTDDNVTTCYFNWLPGNTSYSMFEAGFSYSGGAFGFAGSLSTYVNTGLRLALRYSYNMNNAQALRIDELSFIDAASEPAQYLACALTWDLGWSGKRLYPINRTAVSTTRGGIAGKLDVESGSSLSSSDIDNVSILLNGRTMQQRQIGGSFFVGSLLPGIYSISVDPENLPVELVAGEGTRNVEVKSGTVTHLSIPVYARYGIAGKITGPSGQALAHAVIEISGKDGIPIKRTTSNEFGYYRIDELKKGTYSLKAISINGVALQGQQPKTVEISNDYLFNIDITVSGFFKAPVFDDAPAESGPENSVTGENDALPRMTT